VGVVAIAREYVDAWHVARDGGRVSASAVYLGGHKEFPGSCYLLDSQLH
jgi:hypothetical protein